MFRSRNQVVLPLEIEKIIPKDDPVFKLTEICDKLDYSRLEKEYVRAWRKLNPATMFILLVYAYMRRLYSSRQIEEACKTDIRFMWILGHEPAPDHSTIARFQNEKLVPVIEDLFYQLIERLVDMNEVSYTNVFVDGTKIEANANKYSFVWAKAVEKNLKKLETKMEALTHRTALKYCLREDLSFEELLTNITNGFTEGCNNRIKVLKRNAYGYQNFDRFRNRILHIFYYKSLALNNQAAA